MLVDEPEKLDLHEWKRFFVSWVIEKTSFHDSPRRMTKFTVQLQILFDEERELASYIAIAASTNI